MSEEKQLIEHRSEVIREVMNEYIGSIEAVGEAHTDGRRFSNLKVLDDVLFLLIRSFAVLNMLLSNSIPMYFRFVFCAAIHVDPDPMQLSSTISYSFV